jgi:hypothetical protein
MDREAAEAADSSGEPGRSAPATKPDHFAKWTWSWLGAWCLLSVAAGVAVGQDGWYAVEVLTMIVWVVGAFMLLVLNLFVQWSRDLFDREIVASFFIASFLASFVLVAIGAGGGWLQVHGCASQPDGCPAAN